jgi:hypothetical protein
MAPVAPQSKENVQDLINKGFIQSNNQLRKKVANVVKAKTYR